MIVLSFQLPEEREAGLALYMCGIGGIKKVLYGTDEKTGEQSFAYRD
jgi:hypothetical protein